MADLTNEVVNTEDVNEIEVANGEIVEAGSTEVVEQEKLRPGVAALAIGVGSLAVYGAVKLVTKGVEVVKTKVIEGKEWADSIRKAKAGDAEEDDDFIEAEEVEETSEVVEDQNVEEVKKEDEPKKEVKKTSKKK